jgi:hypothetical protein
MRIKTITLGNRNIDAPKSWPSPKQPTLLTAPDLRIKILTDEDNEIDEYTKLEDAKRNIQIQKSIF